MRRFPLLFSRSNERNSASEQPKNEDHRTVVALWTTAGLDAGNFVSLNSRVFGVQYLAVCASIDPVDLSQPQ